MASATLKLENGLCRCCHAEGTFKSLDSAVMSQEQEIFSNILRECFDVTIIPVDGDLSAVTYTICETCSNRLFEASTFKKQVLSCEERFRDLYSDHVFKTLESLEADVKVELPESFNQDLKEEFSRDDSALDEDDIFTYPDGDGDDDDDKKDLCFELNVDTSEKKRKAKSKRKIKSKEPKVKKSKRGRPKKKLESDTKHDGETTSEQSKSTKKGTRTKLPVSSSDYSIVEDSTGRGKVYACNQCDSRLKTVANVRKHIATIHLQIAKFSCPRCPEKFTNTANKRLHALKYHGIELKSGDSEKLFICDTCGKEFKKRDSITTHIRDQHKVTVCRHCRMKFESKYWYVKHLSLEHGRPMPTCGVCGFKTMVQSKLIVHQRRVHMQEREVPCKFCDMKFFNKTRLRNHMVKHTGERNYVCFECNKAFSRKTTLQFHIRIHTGDKRKICKLCGEAFVQKASLSYHMMKRHPGQL